MNAWVDTLEYNWQFILASYMTPQDCHTSYMKFSFEQCQHNNPTNAIFMANLGSLCLK